MHTLEAELQQLASEGIGPGPSIERAIARERRTLLSLYGELRASLYLSVMLIVSGIGLVIRSNLDRIGPVALILTLAAAGAVCYVPAARAVAAGRRQTLVERYLLLLGALVLSADLGYAESQFHWFGTHWAHHLALLAAGHALTAYLLDSSLVLGVALGCMAGWLGVVTPAWPREPGSWWMTTSAMGARALGAAAIALLGRVADMRTAGGRFRAVYEQFLVHLAFWGVLAWCADERLHAVAFIALTGLVAIVVRWALRERSELFAIYGIVYGALGAGIVLGRYLQLDRLPGAFVALILVFGAAAAIRLAHARLASEES